MRNALPLEYSSRRPGDGPAIMGLEWGGLIGALVLLVGVMPGLYALGKIDIIVINQLGRFLAVAIAAIGLDLVWGYCGVLSLCHAMFFCFGGYAIGMHMALHGPLDGEGIPRCLFVVSSEVGGFQLPAFWKPFQTLPVAIFLAMGIPGLAAFLFGYFAFRSRVRGVYFSIITQATTLALCLIFGRNEVRLCGTNGLTNFVTLGGFDLGKPGVKMGLYLLTVAVLVGVYVACRFFVASRLGRLLVAVRDNESRLRFAGYQPVTIKAFAFTAGAILAGVGGMLYTPQNGIITPAKMVPLESIGMVCWVLVGGRGTLSGAVVGAIAVSYMQSVLTNGTLYNLLPKGWQVPTDLTPQVETFAGTAWSTFRKFLRVLLGAEGWLFVLGGLFIAVTLFVPEGIVGTWKKWSRAERAANAEADPLDAAVVGAGGAAALEGGKA